MFTSIISLHNNESMNSFSLTVTTSQQCEFASDPAQNLVRRRLVEAGQLTHAESPPGLIVTVSVRIGDKLREFIVGLEKVANFHQLAGVLGIFVNSIIIHKNTSSPVH